MITLISTPQYTDPDDPEVIYRWLATESPNNFRLLRQDYMCGLPVNNGGYLQVTLTEDYEGEEGNSIAIYDSATDSMLTGEVTNVDAGLRDITTDIVYSSSQIPTYLNDNTLHGGYYFEGRLTVNGVLYPLTIMASPDSKGYADLDVSGILRIVVSLGKVGDYTNRIMAETNKSGRFSFEYRECWYGSDNSWEGDIITSPVTSPPISNTYYYAECVRSEEQGSNLYDYVASSTQDAPFLNQFENPVYFLGLPFDISFILPEQVLVSPASDIIVDINIYDSNNLLLLTLSEEIAVGSLEGHVCSLTIDPAVIPTGASYITAEISV